jgi:hypothetical protein
MAGNSFNSVTGGLVNSVIANVGNSLSTSVQNLGNPNPSSAGWASVSVNSLLGSTIETSSGFALNAGENYLLTQLGSALPPNENNALANAVITQVASAGISQVSSFVSESVGGLLGGLGSTVTTAGAGAQASRSSKSIPDSVASQLPQADYGGQTYTLEDIVFTLVPANAGAQTAPQPQTSPSVPTDVGFDPAAAASIPAVDALKGATALAAPAQGLNVGGKNFGASYSLGSASTVKPLQAKF